MLAKGVMKKVVFPPLKNVKYVPQTMETSCCAIKRLFITDKATQQSKNVIVFGDHFKTTWNKK